MDYQRSPILTWAYFLQGKNIDELRHSLLCTTLELEQTRIAVHEEMQKRDDELMHLKDLLNQAIRERDEANEKYQKLLLFQKPHGHAAAPLSGISSIESQNGFSSSECEESIVSSPEMVPEKPLPEKGKLLQAVIEAGPLLQTLLLAGPLPQWKHPPPPLESFQIPQVTIPILLQPQSQLLHQDSFFTTTNCGIVNKKRALCEESDSPTATKYQRLVFH